MNIQILNSFNSVLLIIIFLTSINVQTFADDLSVIYFPEDVKAPAWIPQRQADQQASTDQLNVFHDFSFTDQQPESGLNFLHRIVDDAGIAYKAVHYDHGNGIAVADINEDGLLDIYLVNQAGANGLYLNLGAVKFKDITLEAGVAVNDAIGVTASFADIDNDGDADLYVTNVRSPNRLFENQGNGTFKDISKASGLDYNGHSSAAVFFDYNRDGLLDLFLSVIGEYTTNDRQPIIGTPEEEKITASSSDYYVGHKDAFAGHLHKNRERISRLFKNTGNNQFVDVTEEVGLIDNGWTGAATPVDFNQDGWPDLYTLNMQGHDQYWINQQGKHFIKQSHKTFPKTPWGAMGVKSFDYNNDGHMDLIVSDMHSDMSEKIGIDKEKLKADWITENWSASFLRSDNQSIYGNALYRNNGKGEFKEVSDQMNVENYWPWGLSVADLNADGWQDILLTSSMNYPFRYGPNSLLLNNNGKKFIDAEYIVGIEPRRENRTSKAWMQLACADKDAAHPHCKNRNDPVVVHGALGSRSSAIFDLDNDGDLDIVTNEFGDVPQLLISNLTKRTDIQFIKIKLIGRQSNKDGLGAKVTVASGPDRWTQVHDGQSGYLSQSRMPLYFGLGKASNIDSITIVWPNGLVQTITDSITLNSLIEITEPDLQ